MGQNQINENMTALAERKTGVELLRIFAACAVVVLHYYHAEMGGASAVMGGGRKVIMELLICLCCSAVDVFVLISGFFLSEKTSRPLGKPFSLYLQVVIFSFINYGVMLALHESAFNPMHIVATFVPHNYFVVLYTALYLISPLLNRFLFSLSEKEYGRLLLIAIILFSVYNSGVDLLSDITGRELTGSTTISIYGTQQGYNIVNFILLYTIGGYLNRFGFPTFVLKWTWGIISVCIVCIYGWRVLVHQGLSATSYSNPFVIMLAVAILCLFNKIKWHSNMVNELAGAAFTCYLFHLVLIRRIGVEVYAAGPTWRFVLHFILSVVLIYIVSYLVYKLYNLVFSTLVRRLDRVHLSYDDAKPFIAKP
jgi:surface polysaccharide O-acyltransferase-like enzyme